MNAALHTRRCAAPVALVALAAFAMAGMSAPFASVAATSPAPTLFAPGVVSGPGNDGAPTFSPDGRTLLFARSNGGWSAILESHLVDGRWSAPELAAFSGPSSDQHPAFAPDGSHVVYASTRIRPTANGDAALERFTHLYRVDRTRDGWSVPVGLPETVNAGPACFKPSIAANGDLYYLVIDRVQGGRTTFRLHRAARSGDTYARGVPLPFSDGSTKDVDPFIAPDQSYLVFSSAGRTKADDPGEHLYLVRRAGDGWGPVVAMRYDGDESGGDDGEAQVSPDGRTLYFMSGRLAKRPPLRTHADAVDYLRRVDAWDNGNNNAWSLPLAPYLE